MDDKILCIDPISKKLIWDKVKFRLHFHWYNNKNELVLMKRIYVSKNEFITMTYDHLIYIKSSRNCNSAPVLMKMKMKMIIIIIITMK